MDGFKVPQNIPQDLLLIQEFIGVPNPTPKPQQEDEIDSSDSETVSEDEIAADLIKGTDEDSNQIVEKTFEPCDSSSETDSSPDEDSASEPEDPDHISRNNHLQDQDDDEDPLPNASSGTYFQTKHEIAGNDIVIPKVDRIDPDEVLEKVGEVMNIVDRVVIIKGNPSNMLNRGSDRALDSDTLLVFDDRTVMGYVYETFGPTAQPLYQVKFDSMFPLDLERVRIGREVFHVPTKSRFVFVSQIKALKGSDASNVHDEEPADDELEFSDDEAEAAHRSRLKRKRSELRSRSVISSRQSTPNPSQMRDQELADEMYLSTNAYDAHGPYDVDFDSAAGPSRPLPIPYDDPYGDDYTAPVAEPSSISSASSFDSKPFFGRSSGRGRGYDRGEHHGRGRGRGRDRGGQRDRGRGGRGGSGYRSSQQHMDTPTEFDDSTRPLTPTSFAIARATGQVAYNASQHQEQQQQSFSPMYPDAFGNGNSWGYNHVQSQAQFQHQYAYLQQPYQLQQAHMQQAPLVQPHINPRFASAFGIAINAMQQLNQIPSTVQQQQYSPQNSTTHPTVGASGSPNVSPTGSNVPEPRSSFHWTDEWKVDRDPAS